MSCIPRHSIHTYAFTVALFYAPCTLTSPCASMSSKLPSISMGNRCYIAKCSLNHSCLDFKKSENLFPSIRSLRAITHSYFNFHRKVAHTVIASIAVKKSYLILQAAHFRAGNISLGLFYFSRTPSHKKVIRFVSRSPLQALHALARFPATRNAH